MTGPIYGRFGTGRRDSAEPEVIEAFRKGGATVWQLSGRDLPDLAVGYLGSWHFVEVKTNKAKLRPGQKQAAETCAGEPPSIARTAPQARKLMRLWSEKGQSLSSVLRASSLAVSHDGGGTWAALEESERGCACDACHCSPKEGPA